MAAGGRASRATAAAWGRPSLYRKSLRSGGGGGIHVVVVVVPAATPILSSGRRHKSHTRGEANSAASPTLQSRGETSQGPRRRAGRQVSPGAPGVGPTRQPKHLAGREDEGRPPGEEAAAACGDAKRTGDAAGAQSRLASRGGEGGQAGGGC